MNNTDLIHIEMDIQLVKYMQDTMMHLFVQMDRPHLQGEGHAKVVANHQTIFHSRKR